MTDGIEVRFWGVRGSCPAPFADRMVYGGNTACVSADCGEELVIFDGGTGIAALGRWLEMEEQLGKRDPGRPVHILFSHVHLDHIQGFMLFPQLFQAGRKLHIYGPAGDGQGFRQRLREALGPPYWPVRVDQVPAKIEWHDLRPGQTVATEAGTVLRTMDSRHPDGGLLYRLEWDGASAVYGLDCEVSEVWESYQTFAQNCGLLIFDAPYGEEEYARCRGFGHSYWRQGLKMAGQCGAEKLCVCHHDWGRTDGELAEIEHGMKEASGLLCPHTEVFMAREGMRVPVVGYKIE